MAKSSGAHRLILAEIERAQNDARLSSRAKERIIASLKGELQRTQDALALAESELAAQLPADPQADADTDAFYEGAYGVAGEADGDQDGALTLDMILMWEGNVADLLDDHTLERIGRDVVREYELDEADRKDWVDGAREYLKAATQKKPQPKDTPYKGASNVKYPLLTTACMQFAARALPQLVRGDEVIEAKVVGEDDAGEKTKRAQRSASFANDQLIYRCTEWEPGTDTLLHALPAVGHGFRKVYYDQTLRRVRLDFVSAIDVCVPCDAPSLELAPRITHALKKYPYEVERLTRGDDPTWKPHDYPKDAGDSQKPCDYLEQVRYEDLDEDGLSEPYIVTVHKDTAAVVRIDPAFDMEDVQVVEAIDESGQPYPQILSIKRTLNWIDYGFLPDPEGGYYNMGFGQLLAPISAVIDTTINELIDAGHLANTMTGFLSAQTKTRSGQIDLEPNKLKMLPGAANIKEALHLIQFPGPNQTLFNLLEFLITTAKDITSVKDVLTGEAPGSQPATSTLALIEQGLQVFSAIYKRIYRSMTREFELLYKLNARYLSIEDYNRFLDAQPPLPEFGNDAGAGQAPTNMPQGAPQMGLPADANQGMGNILPFPGSQQAGAGGPLPGGSPSPGAGAGVGFDAPLAQPQLPVGPQGPNQGPPLAPSDPNLPAPGSAPTVDPAQLQQALAAQLPQAPQLFDPAQDFNLDDMDIRPVADPSAVTETQRLAKLQFALQFLGNPGVDQGELLKRAFVDSRMAEPEKLMAKPNPLMDMQAQAQVNQVQGEARKVHAEAALLEAQAGGAQLEPQMRQMEMAREDQRLAAETQAKQADAQTRAIEAQAKQMELGFRERELAISERQAQREDMQLELETRRISLEEARQMLEEHRAALDEAERGSKLDLEHGKLEVERERTTLERIKVLGDQKLGRDATMIELKKILADAEGKKQDRDQAKDEGDKDRKLEEKKMEHDVKLKEKDIEAKKEVAEHNNKLKAEVAKVAARNKPKPQPK